MRWQKCGFGLVVLVAVALSLSGTGLAGPFFNGNFESGTAGWALTPGPGAVIIGTGQGVTDGTQSVKWNGGNSGPGATLSQTFDTTPGQQYELQFDYGAFGATNRNMTVDVSVTGTGTLLNASASALAPGGNNLATWDRQHFRFTADSPSTTLTFTDTTTTGQSNSADGNLDLVTITPISPAVSPAGPGALGTLSFLSGNLALASGNPAGLTPVASQSSTGAGGVPSRGIDGNTNGSWGAGSTTHTSSIGPGQWWRVDLGTLSGQPNAPNHSFAIDQVVIFNRSDCCQDRLNEFDVNLHELVGGSPIASDVNVFALGTTNSGNANSAGVSDNQSNSAQSHGPYGLGVFFPQNAAGNQVEINQNGGAVLALAEVQAFGLPNYTQPAGETLEIDIAGLGSHDFVNVEGTALLQGVLDVSLLGGFSPNVGDTFDVLTAASVDASGLDLTDRFWAARVVPGGNGQFLQLQAVPEPATLALAVLGAFSAALLVRRRRRR